MISAGSGITPIASMLRALVRRSEPSDVVHLHSARTREDVVFGAELRGLAAATPRYRLHERITSERERLAPTQLDGLCPDWRERETFACGPAAMLADLASHWQTCAEASRLHLEHFQPPSTFGGSASGIGGTVRFRASGLDARGDGRTPILQVGERAGARLPHGCRMGICHSCVGRLCAGRVRDLRTGEVHGDPGQMVRTCINAPEGAVEIDL